MVVVDSLRNKLLLVKTIFIWIRSGVRLSEYWEKFQLGKELKKNLVKLIKYQNIHAFFQEFLVYLETFSDLNSLIVDLL